MSYRKSFCEYVCTAEKSPTAKVQRGWRWVRSPPSSNERDLQEVRVFHAFRIFSTDVTGHVGGWY